MEQRKGHRDLLAAWGLICGENDVLILAGAGPEEDSVRRLAEDLVSDGGDVRFLGNVKDPWPLYRASDVVVLASVGNEDMPLTLLEAMYAARPCVATRVAGVSEVLDDGATGLVVPPGEPAALGASLLALLRDPDRARRMGQSGRLRYDSLMRNPNPTDRYAAVWRNTVEGGLRARE
jgi:glycosyltransferase involved in cell wall biosynthesis